MFLTGSGEDMSLEMASEDSVGRERSPSGAACHDWAGNESIQVHETRVQRVEGNICAPMQYPKSKFMEKRECKSNL